jgi:hypothetical protein
MPTASRFPPLFCGGEQEDNSVPEDRGSMNHLRKIHQLFMARVLFRTCLLEKLTGTERVAGHDAY